MVYVAATGGVDIAGYLFTIFVGQFVGRKWAAFFFFVWSGISMAILLAIPIGKYFWVTLICF